MARDDDRRLAIGGFVENEVRVFGSVLAIAHLRKQASAESGAFDRLQILLGNDHVGVDVVDHQRRGHSRQCGKLVHPFQALRVGRLPRRGRLYPL